MYNVQLIAVDSNTFITANGKLITNFGANNICWVTIIH